MQISFYEGTLSLSLSTLKTLTLVSRQIASFLKPHIESNFWFNLENDWYFISLFFVLFSFFIYFIYWRVSINHNGLKNKEGKRLTAHPTKESGLPDGHPCYVLCQLCASPGPCSSPLTERSPSFWTGSEPSLTPALRNLPVDSI